MKSKQSDRSIDEERQRLEDRALLEAALAPYVRPDRPLSEVVDLRDAFRRAPALRLRRRAAAGTGST